MAGRQAKLLAAGDARRVLAHVARGRSPERDRVMVLLSLRAGLRAGEIAALTWPMILDARGRIGHVIELHDIAAKKGSGRSIPLHTELRTALARLRVTELQERGTVSGPAIKSMRPTPGRHGQPPAPAAMRASSIVNWFAALYRTLGLAGCSSHSGRRTFVTMAARRVHAAGGSLRDVQQLAGHRSIEMTQRYIEGDTLAKRRLIRLL